MQWEYEKRSANMYVSQSLGVSAYVLQSKFDFSSALLQAIKVEGRLDYLDSDKPDPGFPVPSPPPSDHSSPLSSPPASPQPPLCSLAPEPSTSAPHDLPNKQKMKLQRGKVRSKKHRKRQRQEAPPKSAEHIAARTNPAQRFVPANTAFQFTFSMDTDTPAASTSYVGLRDEGIKGGKCAPTLEALVAQGFTVIVAQPGATIPLAEAQGRVIGVVVYPDDPTMKKCAEEASKLIRDSQSSASFNAKQRDTHRGRFGQLNVGVAHGGGRLKPDNISNSETNAEVLDKDHGFQTENDYEAARTAEEMRKENVRKEGRWEMGLSLLRTLEELAKS
ncbi:hypothetical protein BDP27DRAFT_1440217 [Rhodocollybia butyracea]|uniref:Uncharacterized protein n=1 Tax=Rhodocollybia butyracea TaxID=206335 RepID=A0A9P5P435_9AGAR|nr:hypothetical protein BDP27DRAFT_1440217 [Rhodocollybia butyracea]